MSDEHHRPHEDPSAPSSGQGAAAEQNAASQQPEQVITPEGEVELRYPDGRIEHPAVRHEPRDVRFGCVLALILGACCVAAVHYYVIWRYFWNRAAVQAEIKKSPYPLAPTPSTQLPPEPRLEQIDRMEGNEGSNVYYRQLAKEKVLHSYGPTEEKGFVHIPIEQAMDVVAQEAQSGKLPERNQPPPPGATTTRSVVPGLSSSAGSTVGQANRGTHRGLLDDGESNSGRMFRGESP